MTETSNIVRLTHHSNIGMRGLTADELAACLGIDIQPVIEKIPVKAIIAACEGYLFVSYAQMRAPLRGASYVRARRFTWAVIRQLRPDFTLTRLSLWFDRDHSTILVGIRRVKVSRDEVDHIAMMAREIAGWRRRQGQGRA